MAQNYKTTAGFALGVVALDSLSLGIVVPVLPSLVAQISHTSASQTSLYVGALFSIYALMQFVFSPVIGGLSDHYGRRPILLGSLMALGLTSMLWVWVGSIGWLFAIRILSGLFASNVSTASACVADITPTEKRAQYFGLIGAMFGIGFILGPIIGGILGQMWIRLPFVVAACLIFVNAVFGFFMLPESLPPEKRRAFDLRRANPFGAFKALTGGGGQKRLVFAWCCLWLTVAAHQSSFILSNQVRFGWNILENGLALGAGGVMQAAVMGALVPKVVGKWGERRTAIIGFSFCALAYLIFAFAYSPYAMLAALIPLSLGTIAAPTVQAMISVDAGKGDMADALQGEVQGALSSLQALMLACGPVVMGSLFSYATRPSNAVIFPGAAFVAAAIIAAAAALILKGLHRPHSAAAETTTLAVEPG